MNFNKIYETPDSLITELFSNFDGITDAIRNIATHGGLESLDESTNGKVMLSKVENHTKEINRLISRIKSILQEGQKPNISQTNDFIWSLNTHSDTIVKDCMTRVFRNKNKDYDEDDKESIHICCAAYKESKDRLRVLIISLGKEFSTPTEIKLPY